MKLNSLVIGEGSQLSYYFPKEYERVSSIDINLSIYEDKFYDRIFFSFGENRTYIENDLHTFLQVNVIYTIKLIKFFYSRCNKLIVYGTSELWNNYEGGITIDDHFNFNSTSYIESKQAMVFSIKQEDYSNVIILHPFNFNSIYRTGNFLFGKVFDSILNKKKIEIGDTYFYRDLIHPKHVVERSILAEKDEIIGSGRLIFVNDFIRDLYSYNNLRYEDYVTENFNNNLKIKRKIFYLKSNKKLYDTLEDTLQDFKRNE